MRYIIHPDNELGAWSIVDTESWTGLYKDRDNIIVATVYDGSIIKSLIDAIESLNLPRTIG